MATRTICDVCGMQEAFRIDNRTPIVTAAGRRLLVSLRVEVDEGEREPRVIDICLGCLRNTAKDFIGRDKG